MRILKFLTIRCFTSRTPIASSGNDEKNDRLRLHNDFDLPWFVQASTNELPRKPSGFVAILQEGGDDRTDAINAPNIEFK